VAAVGCKLLLRFATPPVPYPLILVLRRGALENYTEHNVVLLRATLLYLSYHIDIAVVEFPNVTA
jgi:hypothetical protein